MATSLTKDNVVSELSRPGTLSTLLCPEQFAEPGKLADQLAKAYIRDRSAELKPTQLRKVFHALKEKERKLKAKKDSEELGSEDKSDLYLVAPELAYARGRGLIPQDFYELMRVCLSSEKLQTVLDFRRLIQFITAILGYHKYHDKMKGRES